jgi:hypothetical protein
MPKIINFPNLVTLLLSSSVWKNKVELSSKQTKREKNNPIRQGCQMVYFQTKNSPFGYIWEDLGMENIVIHIFWPFGIFYNH